MYLLSQEGVIKREDVLYYDKAVKYFRKVLVSCAMPDRWEDPRTVFRKYVREQIMDTLTLGYLDP